MKEQGLSNRGKYWEGRVCQIGTNYHRIPVLDFISVFEGKSVLEIGPGNRRHTDEISKYAASYSVADISERILKNYACEAFLITDYSVDFGRKYDTIAFWYVIHHVRKGELTDFVRFLVRHLKSDGHLVFNMPAVISEFNEDEVGDDGLRTTPYTVAEIESAFTYAGFRPIASSKQNIDSLVMVWQHASDK